MFLKIDGLEKERDFYFGKLRDVEIMLQSYTGPDPELCDRIFKILYATEEDFVAVEEGVEGTAPELLAEEELPGEDELRDELVLEGEEVENDV